MKKMARGTVVLAMMSSVALAASSAMGATVSAFPGAQGFGGDSSGGRAGSVYVVTNLNDSGAGSFRDAVSASNRIIVFAVSGSIDLLTAVSAKSNLTILGQTAPGDGVLVTGAEVSFFGQSNEIIQYMRFRDGTTDPGYSGTSSTSSSSSNCLNLGGVSNAIVDHVSAEFAAYNNIDASGGTSNITFSNSIIADPIASQRFNIHNEGNNTTYIGNLMSSSHGRNALAKANTQYVNNVVYNYGYAFTTGNSAGKFSFDIVNNYFVAGPSTSTATDDFYQVDSNQSAYAVGNILDGNKDGTLNGSADNSVDGALVLSSAWSGSTALLPTLSAAAAWQHDVQNAGDSLKHDATTYASVQGYDQVDTQVVSDILSNGTAGKLWSNQTQTGLGNNGFGVINTGVVLTSSANNGIPNSWADTHGISNSTTSAAMKLNALGYTMIEQYAYEISDLNAKQGWTNAGGSWVSGSWTGNAPGIYDDAIIRGNGTVNGGVSISGSDVANAFRISIGGNGPAAGETLTMSGGTLTVQDTIYLGDQNNATFNLASGTVRAANLQLGNTVFSSPGVSTSFTGTFNFTGGTLQVGQVMKGAGVPGSWTGGGVWNWSGGTLQANGDLLVNAPATLSGVGGTVNTLGPDGAAHNGTMTGVLSGAGSFAKGGAGVLTLMANNTFAGNTTISGGAIRAGANGAFSNGTIFDNAPSGVQLANGITISNKIVAAPGSSEFADVADAAAVGTISGAVSVTGGSNQYRIGVSGVNASLILSGPNTTSGIALITRGNVIFAANGSLINGSQAVTVGRSSSTSTANLTVKDNAVVQGVGIVLGGLGGTADDLATTVNLTGNGTLSAGLGLINVNNNAIGGAVTFNMNGNTKLVGAGFSANGANQGLTTLNFNGGTVVATSSDVTDGVSGITTPFFPVLGPAATPVLARVLAGGMTVDDGGFGITIAQPLINNVGTTDGGFTKVGNGSVTLAGVNTYNGLTRVKAGQLIVTGSILDHDSSGVAITPDVSGAAFVHPMVAGESYVGWGSSAANDLFSDGDLRAGKNLSNSATGESVTMAWRTRTAGEASGTLYSDVMTLSGMVNNGAASGRTDAYALQMTYASGASAGVQLEWLNGSGQWVNAVAGDFGGGNAFTNVQSSWDAFALAHGVTDANISGFLGSWGVDSADSEVWAIVNHNSSFAVGVPTVAVPEPMGLAFLVSAGPMLLARRRRR